MPSHGRTPNNHSARSIPLSYIFIPIPLRREPPLALENKKVPRGLCERLYRLTYLLAFSSPVECQITHPQDGPSIKLKSKNHKTVVRK